jgi:hypothetical protein
LETKHAYGLVLETLTPYGAISSGRSSDHSQVGPHVVNAVAFQLSQLHA